MSSRPASRSTWSRPPPPGSPHSLTTSSSSAAVGSGRFGNDAIRSSSSASTCASSPSSCLICEPTSRICAIASPASSPERFAWPMASLASLRCARSPSSCGRISRRRASSFSRSSTASAAPRRESAPRTWSGSRRRSFRSSTALRRARACAGLAALRAAALAARLPGVCLQELGHLLGVLTHHDVRRHDRPREAAVADREENVLLLLLADVEVRPVRPLTALDLALRLRPEGRGSVKRVAAGTAQVEEDGAVGGPRLCLGAFDRLAKGGKAGNRQQAEGNGALAARHGRASYEGGTARVPANLRAPRRRTDDLA